MLILQVVEILRSLNNIIICNNLISKEIDVKIITTIPTNIEYLKGLKIKCHLYSPNLFSKICESKVFHPVRFIG